MTAEEPRKDYKYASKVLSGSQKHDTVEKAIRQILVSVGEDPDREGLRKTPHRVAKMYEELLEGYSQDLMTIVNGALYDIDYENDEMVIIGDIAYDSLCEHHMLPFSGKAHIAYIPDDKVIGLSKIPRIVDMHSKRLQVQERLTNEIADCIEHVLHPKGVFVLLEGYHSCASLRGVKKHALSMKTVSSRGIFIENIAKRDEFYKLVGKTT
ncbi:MAG: GTP cyclohydrolase I FolE [Candidatus Heimdallarchaeota archaeon]|nr:GTP cyclohydrolase I FolE [Candidatus Heimdallarchaeota archaeon]